MRFVLRQVGSGTGYILCKDEEELLQVKLVSDRVIEIRQDTLLVYKLKHTSGRTNNLLVLDGTGDWIGTVLKVRKRKHIGRYHTKVKISGVDIELKKSRSEHGLIEYVATQGEVEVGKVYPKERDIVGNIQNSIHVSEERYINHILLALLYHTEVVVTKKGIIKTRWRHKVGSIFTNPRPTQ